MGVSQRFSISGFSFSPHLGLGKAQKHPRGKRDWAKLQNSWILGINTILGGRFLGNIQDLEFQGLSLYTILRFIPKYLGLQKKFHSKMSLENGNHPGI